LFIAFAFSQMDIYFSDEVQGLNQAEFTLIVPGHVYQNIEQVLFITCLIMKNILMAVFPDMKASYFQVHNSSSSGFSMNRFMASIIDRFAGKYVILP